MKSFMTVNMGKKRVERIKEDENGLYIEVGSNLFTKNEKYYLNKEEEREYKETIKHNKKYKKRQNANEETRKDGRYKTVNQEIKKVNGKTGIMCYEYYDKNGKVIS